MLSSTTTHSHSMTTKGQAASSAWCVLSLRRSEGLEIRLDSKQIQQYLPLHTFAFVANPEVGTKAA